MMLGGGGGVQYVLQNLTAESRSASITPSVCGVVVGGGWPAFDIPLVSDPCPRHQGCPAASRPTSVMAILVGPRALACLPALPANFSGGGGAGSQVAERRVTAEEKQLLKFQTRRPPLRVPGQLVTELRMPGQGECLFDGVEMPMML